MSEFGWSSHLPIGIGGVIWPISGHEGINMNWWPEVRMNDWCIYPHGLCFVDVRTGRVVPCPRNWEVM